MLRHSVLSALVVLVLAQPSLAQAEENKPANRKRPYKVAILLFEGVELLDFAGPAEVFIVADYGKSFQVFTVAANTKPLKTMGGIKVTPDHDYKTSPQADVVVVPGGATSNIPRERYDWLKQQQAKAQITMSVCYGAFVLARAGMLNNKQATTHHWAVDQLANTVPSCKVIKGKRFVESGKIVTTAGVTAGIDGALRVVERLLGKEAARWTAEEWMEHRVARKAK